MTSPTARRDVRFKWWVRPYLAAACVSAAILRREPDAERAWARVKSGVKVEVTFS